MLFRDVWYKHIHASQLWLCWFVYLSIVLNYNNYISLSSIPYNKRGSKRQPAASIRSSIGPHGPARTTRNQYAYTLQSVCFLAHMSHEYVFVRATSVETTRFDATVHRLVFWFESETEFRDGRNSGIHSRSRSRSFVDQFVLTYTAYQQLKSICLFS